MPNLPYIVLHSQGSVQLQDVLPVSVRANRAAILSRYWEGLTYCRSDGVRLVVTPSKTDLPSQTILNRMLAFFYNPSCELTFAYSEAGSYDLRTVKETILDYLGRDDDILTQFMDQGQITKAFKSAHDFPAVVRVLKRMEGRHC